MHLAEKKQWPSGEQKETLLQLITMIVCQPPPAISLQAAVLSILLLLSMQFGS